jgi:hypothetical protein
MPKNGCNDVRPAGAAATMSARAVGTGLLAADGIAQRGPGGVGTYHGRPVAEDTGEKVRLADGLPAAEAVGGPLRERGELFEGLAQIPELAERARAAFFAERSEVMASSIHDAGNPRFPGRLDRHDRARERRESVTLVLLASQPTWAAAARRRAGATASVAIITARTASVLGPRHPVAAGPTGLVIVGRRDERRHCHTRRNRRSACTVTPNR